MGTLVLAMPTRDGLVVAADSRSTLLGSFFDGREKLYTVETAHPTIISITGTSNFAIPPPVGTPIATWLPNAEYRYRGKDALRSYLEDKREFELTLGSAEDAAEFLAQSISDYLTADLDNHRNFLGTELCRAVIFQCPEQDSMRTATMAFTVDQEGSVQAQNATFNEYKKDNVKDFGLFGESDYTTTYVLESAGPTFMTEQAVNVWTTGRLVNDFSAKDTADFLRSLIEAVEATSQIIPIPSGNGIGGTPTVRLITPEEVLEL